MSERRPLDLNLYQKYHIDQRYEAYTISFKGLDENQCDDLEADYIQQGYKVFHVEMNRAEAGAFDLLMIVAKMSMTF